MNISVAFWRGVGKSKFVKLGWLGYQHFTALGRPGQSLTIGFGPQDFLTSCQSSAAYVFLILWNTASFLQYYKHAPNQLTETTFFTQVQLIHAGNNGYTPIPV